MDKPATLYAPPVSKVDFEGPLTSAKHVVVDDDSNSSRTSIKENRTFLTEGLDDFYVPIDHYEGRHRYDSKFRWDKDEEKNLVRKVGGNAGSSIHQTVLMLLLRLTSVFAPGFAWRSLRYNLTVQISSRLFLTTCSKTYTSTPTIITLVRQFSMLAS